MSKEVVNGFEFSRLKLLKGGGIAVSYSQCSVEGSVTHIEKITKISPRSPHPDLTDAIEGLSDYVARVHGMFPHRALEKMKSTAKLEMAVKDILPTLKSLEAEVLKSISVTGISLSGDLDNRGVVITAVNHNNNESIALNTSLIRLNGQKFGFENDLQDIIATIDSEVYDYLFKGKSAQLEMDFDEEKKAS